MDFTEAQFKKVSFRNATFSNKADFTNATFSEQAVFLGTSFAKDIDFKGARFKEADFSLANASGKAAFDSATFSEQADFTNATFLELANFHFTVFERGAAFIHSRFLKEANFIRTKFSEKAGDKAAFDSATFSEYVDFGNARFPEKTVFRYSVFKGDVDFSNATFGIFEKQVDFDSEADFTASAFLERADFSGAKFMKAHFVSSSFGEKAYFITTEFYSKANFKQAYFSGQATFFYTQLGDKPDFSDVLFENAQKVLFSVKELLHPTSFINTNITSVRFSKAVNWAEEKIDSSVDLEALKAVYRNLRENYENSFRFIDAQIYHIREMDLKRKYRGAGDIMKGIRPQPEKNGRIRRTFSLTGMYYLISRYGYDYVRPIIAAAVVLLIPIIYSLIQQSFSPGGIDVNESVTNATNYAKDVLHIDRKNDLLGPLIAIVTIPILGGIILAALKRTFDIKRKS